MFFNSLALHGGPASILWGYRPAVVLRSWRVVRQANNRWTLTGTPTRVEAFYARQTPLLFAAPRPTGFWIWPIEKLTVESSQKISATLGPPEQ